MTSNIGPFRFFVRMGCFFVPILECSAFLVTQRKTKTLQRMSNATFFGRRRMSSPNLHLGSLPRGALPVRLAIAIVQRHQKSKKCVVRRNFYAFISGLAEPPPKSRMRRRVLRRLPGGELRISRKRPFSAQTARRRIDNFKEATLFPAAKLHRRGPRPPTGGRRERDTASSLWRVSVRGRATGLLGAWGPPGCARVRGRATELLGAWGPPGCVRVRERATENLLESWKKRLKNFPS